MCLHQPEADTLGSQSICLYGHPLFRLHANEALQMLSDFNARISLQFKMFMTTEFRTVIID